MRKERLQGDGIDNQVGERFPKIVHYHLDYPCIHSDLLTQGRSKNIEKHTRTGSGQSTAYLFDTKIDNHAPTYR
jgi:hypothetical protein